MQLSDLDVLVVDDHEPMRAVLTRVLTAAGVTRLRAAAEAETALAMLHERPADLILTDRNMPGMGGLAFVVAVRGDAALATARILVLSGQDEAAHLNAALAAGADAALVKPVSPRELMAAIAALF